MLQGPPVEYINYMSCLGYIMTTNRGAETDVNNRRNKSDIRATATNKKKLTNIQTNQT